MDVKNDGLLCMYVNQGRIKIGLSSADTLLL
jgi:hypothetical protein